MSTPVEIGDAPVTLNLYLDLHNIASALTGDGPERAGAGCTTSEALAPSQAMLCVDYPNVVGNLGAPPVLERYRLVDPDTPEGAALVGPYFDAGTDLPIGGFSRTYFDDTHFDETWVFGSFHRAYVNDDDLLVVTDASGEESGIEANGDHTMIGFPRLSIGESDTDVVRTDADGATTGNTEVTRLDRS